MANFIDFIGGQGDKNKFVKFLNKCAGPKELKDFFQSEGFSISEGECVMILKNIDSKPDCFIMKSGY